MQHSVVSVVERDEVQLSQVEFVVLRPRSRRHWLRGCRPFVVVAVWVPKMPGTPPRNGSTATGRPLLRLGCARGRAVLCISAVQRARIADLGRWIDRLLQLTRSVPQVVKVL